ncbi:MAG: HEAT repeat domain-containing protein [Opitutaceae bacterium]|nr:HEAT repeat domain-containing protein [Opitutaceae bacterium]
MYPSSYLLRLALALAPAAVTALGAEPSPARFTFPTQTLTVPAGFTVELVAGPPMVNRPISIAYDERGRLYATDSSGLSERAPVQFEKKPHRIVRLEDTDGDGRFDRSVVFAENMMFPQGAMFYEGSLYVAAPPHLWKLTDTNGDGVADERVAWYDGQTLTGCANDLHGPYLGPDGWFYWTKGAFAEQRHTLGNGKPFVTRAAHIFRARPDGTGLEPVLTGGMDNPVGVTFSASGDRFLSGTFFQIGVPGKRDGLIHAIYGGVYGKENAASTGHPRTGDLMPIMTHMGAAAPCGSTTYRSTGFGRDFAENLFVCYFNLRKVSRHVLTPDGATYRTQDSDFITSDSQDFRPTDVLEDADGSLLVADTGGWYKICCPTSQLAKPDVLGGIYRIRKVDAPKRADPRGLDVPWATLTPAELARLLADERLYVQERALHLLGQKGAAAIPALEQAASKANAAAVRRQAVWTLARIDAPAARAAVRQALGDGDATVAQAAVHVTSLWRDTEAVPALGRLLAGPNAAAARGAAEALGRIGDPRAVDALLEAVRRLGGTTFTAAGAPDDAAERVLEHSLIFALFETGRAEALRSRLRPNENPRVVRAALVALDQIEGGGLQAADVLAWLDSSIPRLKQTAGWIVERHPEWGAALAQYFRNQLNAAATRGPAELAALQAQLAPLAKSEAIQGLLALAARDAAFPDAARRLALRIMPAAGLKELPEPWQAALVALLNGADAALAREAVGTARLLPLPRSGQAPVFGALVKVGRDSSQPAAVRLEALAAAHPAAIGAIDAPLFDFLRAHLDGRQAMVVRGAAATVLAKAALTPAQQLALADALRTVGALEAPKLLPAFEKSPTETLGRKLVASLQGSPGLAGIRANVLQTLLAKYPASVRQQGEELLAGLNTDAARQNARVDELLAGVKHGDIRRGPALFNSERTACKLCHTIGYLGGKLGPDLSSIGKIRNERELLEATIYPSATFVRGYEPFVATTKGGETHGGILRKDAPDEIVLATGPDTEQRIARADLTDLQPGPVSPMPPGMDAILSREELADLVTFLKSLQR